MRWLCVVLLSLFACSAPIEKEDIDMNRFPRFRKFGGAFDETRGTLVPQTGDEELFRQAALHGTGTGIREPNGTNFGQTVGYRTTDRGETRRVLSGTVPEPDGANWIVTIQPKQQVLQSDPFLNTGRARIQFGVGGGLADLSVSLAPFVSLSLPGLTAYVDIITSGSPVTDTQFACTLHRGMPNGESEGRLLDITGPADGLGTVIGAIPAFAKRVQTLGDAADPLYQAGTTFRFDNAGFALDYTGPELLAIRDAGGKIDVPAGCFRYVILGLVPLDTAAFSWDIEV